jgi:hypothetical protein
MRYKHLGEYFFDKKEFIQQPSPRRHIVLYLVGGVATQTAGALKGATAAARNVGAGAPWRRLLLPHNLVVQGLRPWNRRLAHKPNDQVFICTSTESNRRRTINIVVISLI